MVYIYIDVSSTMLREFRWKFGFMDGLWFDIVFPAVLLSVTKYCRCVLNFEQLNSKFTSTKIRDCQGALSSQSDGTSLALIGFIPKILLLRDEGRMQYYLQVQIGAQPQGQAKSNASKAGPGCGLATSALV